MSEFDHKFAFLVLVNNLCANNWGFIILESSE